MKKKVLLLAMVALMLSMFDSVPAYAKEDVTVREEKAALETEAGVNAVSGSAVAMGENTVVDNNEQNTQTEAEADKTEANGKEEKNKENDKEESEKEESKKEESEKKDDQDEKEKKETDKKDEKEKDSKDEKDDKDSKDEDSKKKDSKDDKKDKDSKEKDEKEKKDKDKKDEKKENSYSKADVKLLACLIYAEAGNQSYKGKLAVANVVMNRVKSNLFPNSIKGVVYQNAYSRSYGRTIYQFSVASPSVGTLKKALNVYGKRKGSVEIKMEEECIKAAKAALEGKSAFDGKKYLFFCGYSSSLASRKSGVKIGAHYFYK